MSGVEVTRLNRSRLTELRYALGKRELVWFGTRGIDALGLFHLRTPTLIAAQIAPLDEPGMETVKQDNLETRSRLRRDLDQYDIDTDFGLDAGGLKTEFLAHIDAPVCLVAYRTGDLLCRPSFCHADLLLAAPFHLTQRQFEHKPWVERQLANLDGVRVLRSVFVRDNDIEGIARLLDRGPLVGRCSTGSGGAGVFSFASVDDYSAQLPTHSDGFVGITPYLEQSAPINTNACVYESGEVTVFGVSYQLIGIRGLTRRVFGFSGNDFAAAAALPNEVLGEVQQAASTIGRWLHRFGYRGIFGLDMLADNSGLFVSEINARFQASTPLSSSINQALGLPDPTTEHVAAFLTLDAPTMPSVAEQTRAAAALAGRAPVAQAIHRNISTGRLRFLGTDSSVLLPGVTLTGAPAAGLFVDREAMLAKSLHWQPVTSDGYHVTSEVQAVKQALKVAAY